MFWSKNKKKIYTPVNPNLLYKMGCKGCSLHGLVFVMTSVQAVSWIYRILLFLYQVIEVFKIKLKPIIMKILDAMLFLSVLKPFR